MGRQARDNRPNLRPVERIELPTDEKWKIRLIFCIVFLLIGIVAITVGIKSCASVETGWITVRPQSTGIGCADEIKLNYELTDKKTANDVNNAVSKIYGSAAEEIGQALWAFSSFPGNLYEVNHHPNEIVTVSPLLYAAFEKVLEGGSRTVYRGVMFTEYERMLIAEDDSAAEAHDPARNAELRSFYNECSRFIADPAQISLELLDENRVILHVSSEYADLCEGDYLDFGYLKNAICIDYIAEKLEAAGYTNGYLYSNDGMTRLLDRRAAYGVYLTHLKGTKKYQAAKLAYSGPASLVNLTTYPIDTGIGTPSCYVYENGSIVCGWFGEGGIPLAALPELLCGSNTLSCTEILLLAEKVFVADSVDESRLTALCDQVDTLWFTDGSEGRCLLHQSGDFFSVLSLYSGDEIQFYSEDKR